MHICCAPCFIAPYKHLKDVFDIMGFWYNPNIHPYQEYKKRLAEVKRFEEENDIKIIYKDEYNLKKWLQNVVFREEQRCRICYHDRLINTAMVADHGNFDYFSSTLLYSKFQNQKLIWDIAEEVASKYSVKFYDKDLRQYWKEGIELSKKNDMYRQQYCGCIYSEKDRYYPRNKRS